ncbi:ABC transporter permease [Arsenicitalea aurantiaca]|uniref:ABC transporter permease n=1 Tax=Arsenicitalea aurantiaca TaxID=1783274 RepID=A0A433XEH1_9HYPH|nr:ABC transporter permease [Arsenicitalea aurantiaca]RUT32499.1 ABC transporter permease [Arsenicitalea aurantiaca]
MPQSPDLALAPRPAPSILATLARRNEVALLICLLALIIFFSLASSSFLTPRNLTNVLGQASLAMVAGVGVAIVVMSGEIDVSIGSLAGAVGIPLVTIMNMTESLPLGIAGALLLALVVGVVNGYLVAYLGINSLIATLGTMFIIRGGIYLYTGQRSIPDTAYLEEFFQLGNGRFFDFLPYPALISLIILAIFIYVMRMRPFGRQIYAVGGNPEVARLAGFDVRRVKFICLVISALLAGVAGILLSSRLGSAVHVAGLGFEFQVVAAVVLGGVSLAGGVGSLVGVALGVLILSFLSNGLGMLNLATEWQLVVTGGIIIAAVAFDEFKRRNQKQ